MRAARLSALLLLLTLPGLALAARPLVTDDARIVDAKACQLETWIKRHGGTLEYWAVPACTPVDNVEITAGGALAWERGGEAGRRFDSALLQFKTLLRPFDERTWGMGLVAGALEHPYESSDLLGSFYTYAPISLALAPDIALHLNPGWLYERNSDRRALTWGAGGEVGLTPHIQWIGETYGEEGDGNYYQAGFRFWVVPEHVQIDTTYGNRFGGGESFWTFGLRLISLPFLP